MRFQLYDVLFTEFYRTRKNYSVGISEKEKFRTYKTDVILPLPSDITVFGDFGNPYRTKKAYIFKENNQ